MYDLETGVPNWRGVDIAVSDDWKLDYSDLDAAKDPIDVLAGPLQSFGFVVVRGVPVVGASTTEAEAIFKKTAQKIGCPASQSAKLDFWGHVTNRGSDISNPQNRGYESAAELPFHSDRCDLLTLLCVRQAPTGGETRLVSIYSAFQELSQSHPDLAQVLCEPVPFDLRDTTSPKEWALMPVISFDNGTFVARYVRRFIEASQRFEDAPRLSDMQRAAFDALDAILEAPGMSLDLRLEPGEWLIVDNHRLLHARTEFRDSGDPAEARLLLRSWLCWSGSPELPALYEPTYGRTRAGVFRGGVWPETKPLSGIPQDLELARKHLGSLLT